MDLLRKFVDLILYSSVWIALCAAAQVQTTYRLTGIDAGYDIYTLFVFAATLCLYSIHRVVGIEKVSQFESEGRFSVIKKYKSHIVIYGFIGCFASIGAFLFLPFSTWLLVAVPAIMSLAYVVPFRKNRQRLRDYAFVKIFLIAVSWSLLTAVIPVFESGGFSTLDLFLIFAERVFFILAITIPFDIRDIQVDDKSDLKTIPGKFGVLRSKQLATLTMIISAVFTLTLINTGVYPRNLIVPLPILIAVAILLIYGSRPGRDDYYFTGAVDGIMLFYYGLIAAFGVGSLV